MKVQVLDNFKWVKVCAMSDLESDDVLRFDFGSSSYAVYRTESGCYASDGWCTHEQAHLADGLVLEDVIECPLHNGRFHIPTGKALNPPVCVNLRTYPTRIENDDLMLGIPQSAENA